MVVPVPRPSSLLAPLLTVFEGEGSGETLVGLGGRVVGVVSDEVDISLLVVVISLEVVDSAEVNSLVSTVLLERGSEVDSSVVDEVVLVELLSTELSDVLVSSSSKAELVAVSLVLVVIVRMVLVTALVVIESAEVLG